MTAAPGYVLRAYRPGDEEVLLPLLQASLGETAAAPQSAGFWSWKHLENPFGISYGLFAWDDGAQQALALRVLMRWRFTDVAGRSVETVRAVDTATSPGCRRMGLFTSLTTRAVADLSRSGTRFIFNTPNAASLPGYLKLGWQVVASWPMHVRPLRPLRILATTVPRPRSSPASLPPWERFFREGTLRWRDFRERHGDDVARVTAAWERVRPRRGLRTERTPAYLDWRYGGHPRVTYAVVPLCRGTDLAGYAVLRPNVRRGLTEAVLTEIALREADRALADGLLRAVRMALRTDYVVACFAPGSFELSALRRSWYFRAPMKGMTFTVRRLGEEGPDPRRAEAWDLTAGDLEIF